MTLPDDPRPRSLVRRAWSELRASLSSEQHDFTRGNLHRAIFLLAVPMMLEMAGESVFAIVDTYFVAGRGADAVAAVGQTEAVMTLLYALAIGLSMSTTAMVSRRIGEGDQAAARSVTFQAIALGTLLSAVIAVAGVTFADDILRLMNASDSVVETGVGYTRVMFATNVVIILLFLINAAFRGAGDPRLAMQSLLIANGVNIVLDPCLIEGFGPFPELGVTGAAVATTIGRGTGVAFQFWVLAKGAGRLGLDRDSTRLVPATMLRLVRVSGGGIAQMLIGTASWAVLMGLVSDFGTAPAAGYTIAVRILMVTFLPAWGLSNAAATLVGQNLGAANPDRAERSVWLTGIYTTAFLALVTVLFLMFAADLVAVFTADKAVVAYAVDALRTISYGYVFYAWGMVMMQAFNGAGDTMTPTWLNLFCFWFVQIPCAYLLSEPTLGGLGPSGVFWSVMGAESILAVASVLVFRRGRWKSRVV